MSTPFVPFGDVFALQRVREEFERLVAGEGTARVVFVPADDVVVPDSIWEPPTPHARLKFSHAFANILSWDDAGVRQRLLFPPKPGAPFDCYVPWRTVLWVDDGTRRGAAEAALGATAEGRFRSKEHWRTAALEVPAPALKESYKGLPRFRIVPQEGLWDDEPPEGEK